MNATLLTLALVVMAPGPKDAPKKDMGKLDGEWTVESIEGPGKKDVSGLRFQFVDGKVLVYQPKREKPEEATFTADYTKKTPEIDIRPDAGKTDKIVHGIFRITGDKLEICFAMEGKVTDRPTEFKSDADKGIAYFVLKRKKAD